MGNIGIFIQGRDRRPSIAPDLMAKLNLTDVTDVYANPDLKADASTDDWPFFYMPERRFPTSYIPMAVIVLALSLVMSRICLKSRLSFESEKVIFFLLGAGFMLIETKAITELGLTFGNTWHVRGNCHCRGVDHGFFCQSCG